MGDDNNRSPAEDRNQSPPDIAHRRLPDHGNQSLLDHGSQGLLDDVDQRLEVHGNATPDSGSPTRQVVETAELTKVGPSEFNDNSASKATTPMRVDDMTVHENLSEDEDNSPPMGNNIHEDSRLEVEIEELGSYGTRMKFKETKTQYEKVQEEMKERAIVTMIECLAMQQNQSRIQQQRILGTPARVGSLGLSQDLPSKRSLVSACPSSMRAVQSSMSQPPTKSDISLNCTSVVSSSGGKPNKRMQTRLNELEKQVYVLERQFKKLDRHLREHNRDQKNMRAKIHSLEMRVLHDGQKQVVWDIMNKIPTEEDLRILESFHSFAVERKRTESQIKVLNGKVKALNQAMGQMTDPKILPCERNSCSTFEKKLSIPKHALVRLNVPDFTMMSLKEREEFFRTAGVTLYEYDIDELQPVESRLQLKQRNVKKTKKKILFGESETTSPMTKSIVKRKTGRSLKTVAEDSPSTSTAAIITVSEQLDESSGNAKEGSPSGSVLSNDSTDSEENDTVDCSQPESPGSNSSPEQNG